MVLGEPNSSLFKRFMAVGYRLERCPRGLYLDLERGFRKCLQNETKKWSKGEVMVVELLLLQVVVVMVRVEEAKVLSIVLVDDVVLRCHSRVSDFYKREVVNL